MHTSPLKTRNSHLTVGVLDCFVWVLMCLYCLTQMGHKYFAKFIEKSAYKYKKYFLNPTISKPKKLEKPFPLQCLYWTDVIENPYGSNCCSFQA